MYWPTTGFGIVPRAADLVEKRDSWLNPEIVSPEDLARRTLTNLYNERPAWLDHAHAKLDAAGAASGAWRRLSGWIQRPCSRRGKPREPNASAVHREAPIQWTALPSAAEAAWVPGDLWHG